MVETLGQAEEGRIFFQGVRDVYQALFTPPEGATLEQRRALDKRMWATWPRFARELDARFIDPKKTSVDPSVAVSECLAALEAPKESV